MLTGEDGGKEAVDDVLALGKTTGELVAEILEWCVHVLFLSAVIVLLRR